jgi:hypothetical protein
VAFESFLLHVSFFYPPVDLHFEFAHLLGQVWLGFFEEIYFVALMVSMNHALSTDRWAVFTSKAEVSNWLVSTHWADLRVFIFLVKFLLWRLILLRLHLMHVTMLNIFVHRFVVVCFLKLILVVHVKRYKFCSTGRVKNSSHIANFTYNRLEGCILIFDLLYLVIKVLSCTNKAQIVLTGQYENVFGSISTFSAINAIILRLIVDI